VEHIFVNAKIYVAVSDSQLCGDGPVVLSTEPSQGPVEDLSKLLGSLESSLLSAREASGEQVIDQQDIAGFAALLEQARELLPALRDGLSAAAEPPGPVADILPAETITETETVEQPFVPVTDKPDFDPLSESDVRCYIADILSGEPQREARGYQQISQLGAKATESLYFFLSQTDDAHAGHICARFLKSLAPDFPDRVQQDMESNIDPSVKLRLLQYAAPALEEHVWQSVLVAGLQQEEAAVREALHQLETQFPEDASRLLIEVLPACPDYARYEICVCLGKLGDSRCLPQLLGYLERAMARREVVADRFSEGVCHALGHFNDPQVVQKLGLLLSSNGILPWQKKRVPSGLRKAALMALERIGGNAVYAVLKRCENDKDPWIRFRVRNFLKGRPLAHRPSRPNVRHDPSEAA
jgi:hypothetical protein